MIGKSAETSELIASLTELSESGLFAEKRQGARLISEIGRVRDPATNDAQLYTKVATVIASDLSGRWSEALVRF